MDIRNKTTHNHSTLQQRSQPKYKKSHNIKTGKTEVKKIRTDGITACVAKPRESTEISSE